MNYPTRWVSKPQVRRVKVINNLLNRILNRKSCEGNTESSATEQKKLNYENFNHRNY